MNGQLGWENKLGTDKKIKTSTVEKITLLYEIM